MDDFDMIWSRIRRHQGQTFHQIRGGAFTYEVTTSAVLPDRTNQLLPKAHFEQAWELMPLRSTVPVQHLRGPSYLYAILMDARISGPLQQGDDRPRTPA